MDADAELVKTYGIDIPAIFATEGEAGFRVKETAILETIGKKAGLVLATGGGCVTRAKNYPLLHQNGTIYWLKRDLGKLPIDGRPLSQANRLVDLYAKRQPLYTAFADVVIDNDGPLEETLARFMEVTP